MRHTTRRKQKKLRRLAIFTLIAILLLGASSHVINTFTNQYANIGEKYSKHYSGFYYDQEHLSANSIVNHLKTNNPVLVCVWDKCGENRWTTSSHYMVLLAADDSDRIYVSNPNGKDRTFKSSGWYPTDEIIPYIAKALYIQKEV